MDHGSCEETYYKTTNLILLTTGYSITSGATGVYYVRSIIECTQIKTNYKVVT